MTSETGLCLSCIRGLADEQRFAGWAPPKWHLQTQMVWPTSLGLLAPISRAKHHGHHGHDRNQILKSSSDETSKTPKASENVGRYMLTASLRSFFIAEMLSAGVLY